MKVLPSRASTRHSAGISSAATGVAGLLPHPSALQAQFRTLQQRARGPAARRGRQMSVDIRALDAAMPFDFEHKAQLQLTKANQLTIGIVGFGTFGQFMGRRLVQAGHKVLATSRGDYAAEAARIGVEFCGDPDDFCESHPDVVVLATSITSTEAVLRGLPLTRLKRSTLFVDVLSVKEFPKKLFLSVLPPEVDIMCTHPMFGPDSGKGSWAGLKFMYEKVRVGAGERRQRRADQLLQFFQDQGCDMEEMSCERHDELASRTQFVTHTIGRVLGAMDLQATSIDTRGFRSLLDLVENTTHDSFDLYYGLFMYNQNATEELSRLEQSFDYVKKQLFDRMHNTVRKQLFQTSNRPPLLGSPSGIGAASASATDPAKMLPHPADASTADSNGGGSSSADVRQPEQQHQQQLQSSNGSPRSSSRL